jgi:hypothetical protein
MGIGVWHVHGHIAECFPRYYPAFIPGTGDVDGEILETLWSHLNLISGSTRGMSAAHRREVLDDHMNDSNWKKLVGIGEPAPAIYIFAPALIEYISSLVAALCKRYRKAQADLHVAEQEFQDLTGTVESTLLEEWKAAEAHAMMNRSSDVKVMDIYDVQVHTGMSFSHCTALLITGEISTGACKLSAGAQSERVW